MRNSVIEVESTLTDRYQTTVPETVRQALHLCKRDKIHYIIQGNGSVLITRADNEKDDPVVENFLAFVAKDMQNSPQNIMSLNSELSQLIQALVLGVELELDKPLLDEDE